MKFWRALERDALPRRGPVRADRGRHPTHQPSAPRSRRSRTTTSHRHGNPHPPHQRSYPAVSARSAGLQQRSGTRIGYTSTRARVVRPRGPPRPEVQSSRDPHLYPPLHSIPGRTRTDSCERTRPNGSVCNKWTAWTMPNMISTRCGSLLALISPPATSSPWAGITGRKHAPRQCGTIYHIYRQGQ